MFIRLRVLTSAEKPSSAKARGSAWALMAFPLFLAAFILVAGAPMLGTGAGFLTLIGAWLGGTPRAVSLSALVERQVAAQNHGGGQTGGGTA